MEVQELLTSFAPLEMHVLVHQQPYARVAYVANIFVLGRDDALAARRPTAHDTVPAA
eukprot:CAMPEP_0182570460 /NCGR_PEP_ID=MMETSP1324-20130603/10777_1 /TAXON_ID=236786 /ORGANISM="Florenciella sp., Strain RCC1587" /LENGTH=56 /DNA_ID=CAMNT_0024784861 /DNA_START=400 /DNA_END=570 /DNA_ORIENTATION=-